MGFRFLMNFQGERGREEGTCGGGAGLDLEKTHRRAMRLSGGFVDFITQVVDLNVMTFNFFDESLPA